MARPTKNEALLTTFIDRLADALAARLAATGTTKAAAAPVARRKRHFSPEAIARIRAGAKKRWAAFHRAKAATA